MIPEYLVQGEPARLFPVLATTSKEGRATSIFLACLSNIDEFRRELLQSLGLRVGKRTVVETYTEIVFKDQKADRTDRPDGLIVSRVGNREWRALVEAKVGNSEIEEDQIERYRALAKIHDIDCVITISNQFATNPEIHPLEAVRRSRSKIPVCHWSWMFILTAADLILSGEDMADADQFYLLNELRRFLTHESTGVKGFSRMPSEWTELNRLVSAGGKIPAKSPEALIVLEAWHQETKDLSLILSRQTETFVTEKLSRKCRNDAAVRQREELTTLRDENRLFVYLDVPNAASTIEVVADIARRTVDVGMTVRAPADRKSSKARVNWLLRQIKTERTENLNVRLNWPKRSEATQFSFDQLKNDSSIVECDKEKLSVVSFHVYYTKRLGARFTQQTNFIADLEEIIPEFYGNVGQNLIAWHERAPKVKPDRGSAEEVTIEALAEEAGRDAQHS